MPMTSTKNASEASPSGVNSSTGPRCASSLTIQPVQLVRERARLELRALVGLLGLARQRGREDLLGALGGDYGDAVGVEHDQVARTDLGAADHDGHVERAAHDLGRPARA